MQITVIDDVIYLDGVRVGTIDRTKANYAARLEAFIHTRFIGDDERPMHR